MTEFAIHTIDSAPAASREILTAAEKKYGFVPNLLGELSAAPVALEAYVTLNDLLAQTTFSPVEQQLILTAVSIANSCEYCVAAHSGGLKMAGLADEELDALRSGRRLKDPQLEALRVFVTAIVSNRGWVKPELHQKDRWRAHWDLPRSVRRHVPRVRRRPGDRRERLDPCRRSFGDPSRGAVPVVAAVGSSIGSPRRAAQSARCRTKSSR